MGDYVLRVDRNGHVVAMNEAFRVACGIHDRPPTLARIFRDWSDESTGELWRAYQEGRAFFRQAEMASPAQIGRAHV